MHNNELIALAEHQLVREIEIVRLKRPKGRAKWAVQVNGEVLRSAALPIRPFASLDTAVDTVTALANWKGVCTVTTTPTTVEPDPNPYPRVGSPGVYDLINKWRKIVSDRYDRPARAREKPPEM